MSARSWWCAFRDAAGTQVLVESDSLPIVAAVARRHGSDVESDPRLVYDTVAGGFAVPSCDPDTRWDATPIALGSGGAL